MVFPSLTPHATGINRTGALRKPYILQYALDGTVALRGDPADGPGRPELEANPGHQFLVFRNGKPPSPRPERSETFKTPARRSFTLVP